jgi:hypothetical protein
MGEWLLSQREARHEVPGSAVWTFGEGHVGEFPTRRSYGRSVSRSGLKSVAQGGSPHPNNPEGATRYGDNRLGND